MKPKPIAAIQQPEQSYNEAETRYRQGRLSEAQLLAEAGYKRFLISNPDLAGRFRLLQIRSALGRGKYDEVLTDLTDSLPEAFATCGNSARSHLLAAFAHASLGDDSKSQADADQAKQQCSDSDPLLGAELANMRGILEDPPAEAERDYTRALTIARQRHNSYLEAGTLLNLGNSALNQEHYDQSIDWSRASLQISREFGYRIYEEKAEGNLAFDYYEVGDLDQALILFGEADQEARAVDVGYDKVRWRNNSGLVHEKTGQLRLALLDYQNALAMATQQGDENQITIALGELAMVSIRIEEWGLGKKFAEQALKSARQEQNHTIELEALLAKGLIASHDGDQCTAEKLLLNVARDPDHERQSLRWEAQSALAGLYAKDHDVTAANAEYRTALDTASQARCTIHKEDLRLPFFTNTSRLNDSYIDFLIQQGKTAEALHVADESRALTLAEGLGVEGKKCLASEGIFAPQRVARQLQATILFYWLGAEHSYLWVISPGVAESGGTKLFPLPSRGEIEPHIQAYKEALLGSRDVLQTEDSNGEQLYQTLLAPAAEYFHQDGRVIVVADGALSGLNFESLIAPRPQPHYWIDDVTVENASSLRLLATIPKEHHAPAAQLLLIGNPKPSSNGEFAMLPHASEEIQAVGKYFPASEEQVYQEGGATANAYVTSGPEHFRYIHFVAHGEASLTDPLDSAVFLSPSISANENIGAYKLYARDVIAHPLQAELVTISACKGAGSRAYAGEGLVGLSWAFLHAGAHNVIGALWDVSDASTPQLMNEMYAQLAQGRPPDAALRAAKLSLLHGQIYHKPIYWAAFQLYTRS